MTRFRKALTPLKAHYFTNRKTGLSELEIPPNLPSTYLQYPIDVREIDAPGA